MAEDTTGRAPDGGDQPEHYWSMEHHSYRAPSSAPATTMTVTPHRNSRGMRRRLVIAGFVGSLLVAGVGSVAVATSAQQPDTAPIRIGQAEHRDAHGGFGDADRFDRHP